MIHMCLRTIWVGLLLEWGANNYQSDQHYWLYHLGHAYFYWSSICLINWTLTEYTKYFNSNIRYLFLFMSMKYLMHIFWSYFLYTCTFRISLLAELIYHYAMLKLLSDYSLCSKISNLWDQYRYSNFLLISVSMV